MIILDETRTTEEHLQDNSSENGNESDDPESIDDADKDSDYIANEADIEDDLADDRVDERPTSPRNNTALSATPNRENIEPLQEILEQHLVAESVNVPQKIGNATLNRSVLTLD